MSKQYFWILQHTVPFSDDFYEYTRTLGYFSSKKRAIEAKNSIRIKPGFSNHPKNFYIGKAYLGWEGWNEGFIEAE